MAIGGTDTSRRELCSSRNAANCAARLGPGVLGPHKTRIGESGLDGVTKLIIGCGLLGLLLAAFILL